MDKKIIRKKSILADLFCLSSGKMNNKRGLPSSSSWWLWLSLQFSRRSFSSRCRAYAKEARATKALGQLSSAHSGDGELLGEWRRALMILQTFRKYYMMFL